MLVATIVTFFAPGVATLGPNLGLIVVGIALGGGVGWYAAVRVAMTNMPQMVAAYNGMGGGAAAGIAAVELLTGTLSLGTASLSLAGAIIGSISFAGSMVAFLKLQGWMRQRPITFALQQPLSLSVLVVGVGIGLLVLAYPGQVLWLWPFYILLLGYGFLMALPIGGADMPVVIALFNALTGVAVGLDGFAITNFAMVVAGVLVGAAGSLLTILMARAMNRSVSNVLFGAFGAKEIAATAVQGSLKSIDAEDAAVMMAYASKVIIAPGYGMAVAQAQQKVKELADLLESRGVQVKFAIHPVAGRMPGHMNVLLAEAGVSYDHLFDRDEINPELPSAEVALVIGANDVVNPAARRPGSPLAGMPILEVDQAKNVIVIKRGQGKGFAGIENELFFKDNTRMLYGDAQEAVNRIIQGLKKL
jgi:NAD(P) transhydrogenase subunit beta